MKDLRETAAETNETKQKHNHVSSIIFAAQKAAPFEPRTKIVFSNAKKCKLHGKFRMIGSRCLVLRTTRAMESIGYGREAYDWPMYGVGCLGAVIGCDDRLPIDSRHIFSSTIAYTHLLRRGGSRGTPVPLQSPLRMRRSNNTLKLGQTGDSSVKRLAHGLLGQIALGRRVLAAARQRLLNGQVVFGVRHHG